MKKIRYYLSALVAVFVFTVSCEKEKMITVEELPLASNTFLKAHFEGIRVSHVKKEKEGLLGTEYTAYLENGISINFDKDGNWMEVDAPNTLTLPRSFLHENIIKYLDENYPNEGVRGIEKEHNRFEVELTNGFDLKFNTNGDFIGIG